MNSKKQNLSIEEVKQIDLVDYLSSLGIKPSKIRNIDFWYLSPLRDEKTPSFKVNRRLNRWFDYGIGKGGSIIDFAVSYYHCSIVEFLRTINGNSVFQKPTASKYLDQMKESKLKILHESKLRSFSLLRYLNQRRIPIEIAEQFCREVCYELNGKINYGIGFKKDSGGFEIRNPYFKASSSPKDISTKNNGSKEAVVFEGFFDFLSFIAMHKNRLEDRFNFCILNSISFFEKARQFMERHDAIRLYLDCDKGGQNCSNYALNVSKKYTDESRLYTHHKDLNDWLVNTGISRKHTNRKRHL